MRDLLRLERSVAKTRAGRFAALVLGSLVAATAWAQPSAGGTAPAAQAKPPVAAAHAHEYSTFRQWSMRHGLYFKRNWGVEIVGVSPVESGYMLAFRYRIIDPNKALMLNDLQAPAYLIDEATGIRLAVPALEKVGPLRTGFTPVKGRTYFMIFGNPGKLVKRGGHVTIVVGNFRAEGVVVD
jgi:hypothetical protein